MSEEKYRPKLMVMGVPHRVTYTNYRGETAKRTIIPINLWYGHTEWHTEDQWLLRALDTEKDQIRDFAMKDMTPAWD